MFDNALSLFVVLCFCLLILCLFMIFFVSLSGCFMSVLCHFMSLRPVVVVLSHVFVSLCPHLVVLCLCVHVVCFCACFMSVCFSVVVLCVFRSRICV